MISSAAVVVPTFRAPVSDDERMSLRRLAHHLGSYDRFLLMPASLDVELPDLASVRLDDRHFRTHHDYCRLMLSDVFYRRFSKYEFVLVHQLDSLVFSDDLARWCGEGYDYVGAPWVRETLDGRLFFSGVGNGGFSLRRVESCLRVLEVWRTARRRLEVGGRHLCEVARRVAREPAKFRQLLRDRYVYEDKFWSFEAPRLCPQFRIPPPEVAVAFAFETHPRFCLERNGGRLPFGCHKWRAHDPGFWEQHVPRTPP